MSKTKILIVDDEIISASALAIELKDLGYETCSLAAFGEKAIEIAENEKPDVVLMDIGLCGPMDGIEAAGQIKNRFGIPVIYMTGYADEKIKEKAGVTEAYEYLIKPVQSIDIKNAIDSVLQKQKRRNEVKREQSKN